MTSMGSTTGRECRIPGIYKSYCCSYEVALSASVSYPRCPRCAAWATWIPSSPPSPSIHGTTFGRWAGSRRLGYLSRAKRV